MDRLLKGIPANDPLAKAAELAQLLIQKQRITARAIGWFYSQRSGSDSLKSLLPILGCGFGVLLLCAIPAHANWVHKQDCTISQGATPQTCVFGSANTSGSVIVASIFSSPTGTFTPAVSDGTNGSYTALAPADSNAGHNVKLFYVANTANTALTITCADNGGSNHLICAGAEFTGGTTTVDKSAGTTTHTAGTAISSDSITTTNANDLLIGALADCSAGTITQGAGWTSDGISTTSCNMVMEYQIVSATSTYAATATLNNSQSDWVAVIGSWKASGGAACTPTLTLLGVGRCG